MTMPILLFAIGLAFALIEEFQASGRSLIGWAVVAVCLGLLWGQVG